MKSALKNKSKLYYFSIVLLVFSVLIIAYSIYGIGRGQGAVDENLALWNTIKDASVDGGSASESFVDEEQGLVGQLKIDGISMRVPLIKGSTDKDLESGAVHYSGTAEFGENGNAIVLGHRDGVFRPLEDVQVNDEVIIETLQGSFIYTVEQIKIVEPTDPLIIQDYDYPAVTLVTCYPFSYIGNAPERFIVIGKLSEK